MRNTLQTALDNLTSPRSKLEAQRHALQTIEKTMADLLLATEEKVWKEKKDLFISTQDSFQCNVPSRMLSWIVYHTNHLRLMLDRCNNFTQDEESDFRTITSHLVQALCIIQGITFLHSASKEFMGRQLAMEILLDLLIVSRQTNPKPLTNATSGVLNHATRSNALHPPLASAVLDTLLCIMVDSPQSIRAFEEANGVELVVKLLKRAANPKDVRMKCLEFLYFYLMDETPADVRSEGSPTHSSRPVASSSSQTAHPRSSSSLTCVSDSSNFSDFESWSPAPTIASTPPQSPTKANKAREPHSRLGMLKRDVDFVPMSPKKAQVAQLGIGKRRDTKQPNRGRVPSPLGPTSSCDTRIEDDEDRVDDPVGSPTHQTRSTEDKKRILGQLLGNVDALVEGVKKAGIWGLAE